MFIIVKITKSAKFRNQFRRDDEDEVQGAEFIEIQNGLADDENINIGHGGFHLFYSNKLSRLRVLTLLSYFTCLLSGAPAVPTKFQM